MSNVVDNERGGKGILDIPLSISGPIVKNHDKRLRLSSFSNKEWHWIGKKGRASGR